MNDIQVFDFEDNAVRVIDKDGDPWFVAADVARVLEFKDARDACRCLDDDESAPHIMRCRSENGVEQNREIKIINESGLYHLVLASRKPEAKKFRKWVTAEVLPSIRKTGSYDLRAGGDFSALPDRAMQQWINLIRETRLLYGRAAARELWEKSPLPAVAVPERDDLPQNDDFDGGEARKCLEIVKNALPEAERAGAARFVYKNGSKWLFVPNSHPFWLGVFKNTPFAGGAYRGALIRAGAVRSQKSVRIGRWSGRGVLIPNEI
jgi:prophage antirepressor-like protein